MSSNQEPKLSKAGIVIIGIAAVIFGIIWTSQANSMTRYSSFGSGPSTVLTAGGILFIIAAIVGTVSEYRKQTEKEQQHESPTADYHREEDLMNRIVDKVKEVQPQKTNVKWSCPYCGTSVDEDSTFCPGCGAGRKKA